MIHNNLIKNIIENFYNVERECGLFDVRIRGVQLYPHIRMKLYYEIMKQLEIFSAAQPTTSRQKSKAILNALKYCVSQNDKVIRNKKCEILAIESTRRDPELKRNIYLYFLLEKLQYDCCVIRNCDKDGRYTDEEKNDQSTIFYDYFLLKSFIYRKIIMRGKIQRDLLDLANLINKISQYKITKNINIRDFVYHSLQLAYSAIYVARNLVKTISPRLLVVEDAYGHSALVDAAKYIGIPVIELQHSVIYPYHLGYAYPQIPPGSIDIFPDYFFTYGTFWKNKAPFPLSKESIIPTGFPYFEKQIRKWKDISRNAKQILFISQNTIGNKLIKIAIDVAHKLPDHTIKFKLHPKQYDYTGKFPEECSTNIPGNMIILGADSPPLYALFGQSAVQVGVFSTALYEGLGFGGLKTIICKLPGWEFVEDLISEEYAGLAADSDHVVELILENKEYGYDPAHIFKLNAVENMCDSIRKILNNKLIELN